jgi:raffinose/stachyose/melibiose transport system permease protein
MSSATVTPYRKMTKKQRKAAGYHPSAKTPWGSPVVYFIALVLVAVCIVPVLYIIFGGFRTNSQITLSPSGFPNPWMVSNYINVLKAPTFWIELVNSLITAVVVTVAVVILSLMVSFVIARYNFKLQGLMYSLFAAGLMFPMSVAITPLFILIRNLGLVNTLPGLMFPEIAFALPQAIIIMVPFIKAIPMELEEAASLDGCSRLGFFFRMVLPLSMPGAATIAILTFIGSWNQYMLPLFVMSDENNFTLPLGVQAFSSQHSTDTAMVLAFTSLSMLPAIIFFTIFQKRIVGGLTGAVKG